MKLSPDMLPLPALPVHRLTKRFVLTADTWEEALRGASTSRSERDARRRVFEKFYRDMWFGNHWGMGYVEPTAKEELISRLNTTLRGKINGSPTNWLGLPKTNDDYRLLTGKRL